MYVEFSLDRFELVVWIQWIINELHLERRRPAVFNVLSIFVVHSYARKLRPLYGTIIIMMYADLLKQRTRNALRHHSSVLAL